LAFGFGWGFGFGFAAVVAVVVAGVAGAGAVACEDEVEEDAPQPASASATRYDSSIAGGRGRVMAWLLLAFMVGDSTPRTPAGAIASRATRPGVYARAVHFSELTPPEQRVLGCLIEKRWTTPDQYPLSLNGLRLACNQATNRDPVTDYDEGTVRDAAQRLCRYGLARLASGHGSRATKYRHLAEEALGLGREELAVLAVLLLRGPQTPGELKARTERMAALESLGEVERVLAVLGERDFARRLERRPGQKEDRFEHLLGGTDGEQAMPAAAPARVHPEQGAASGLEARVEALEAEVAALREELAALRSEGRVESAAG
jgi:uncharacterized protein YceH (UPF0502 family)